MGLSTIEGIDQFYARFTLLATNLKKKPYDALDHRKQDFDMDYQEFKVQLDELNVSKHPHILHSEKALPFFSLKGSAKRVHGAVL